MPTTWTDEQINGLAATVQIQRSALQMADPPQWRDIGRQGSLLWGASQTVPRSGHRLSRPVQAQVTVDTATMQLSCSCRSRHFPCGHALGLLLLWQRSPAALPPAPAPDWRPAVVPPSPDDDRLPLALTTDQFERLDQGLTEFRRWLTDVMDQGLARLPDRPAADWQQMTNRLIDAGAPELARRLGGMEKLQPRPKRPDWPERFLRTFGRFFLLLDAFARYGELPVPLQTDLRLALGWRPRRPVEDAPGVDDTWLVTGRQTYFHGRRLLLDTWFWGLNSRRPAVWRQQIGGRLAAGAALPTGAQLRGRLFFVPGAIPLMVTEPLPEQLTNDPAEITDPGGGRPLAAAAAGLASGPWHEAWPLLLPAVLPEQSDGGWQLRSPAGDQLPLSRHFNQGWRLLALSGRQPLSLFGLWNGRAVDPLAAGAAGQWEDLRQWPPRP